MSIQKKINERTIGCYQQALYGSLKPTDAFILADMLRKYRPRRILEVGSFLGVSSRWILEISDSWQAGLVSVDPNVPHRVFNKPRDIFSLINNKYSSGRLEIVNAMFGSCDECLIDYLEKYYSCERTKVKELIKLIPVIDVTWEQRFDFIFIDGEHTYDSVMNNFEVARSLLAPCGCIVFHDALSWPGVSRALGEIAELFEGRAEVEILGQRDRRLLRLIGRANDGIGIFRSLA